MGQWVDVTCKAFDAGIIIMIRVSIEPCPSVRAVQKIRLISEAINIFQPDFIPTRPEAVWSPGTVSQPK